MVAEREDLGRVPLQLVGGALAAADVPDDDVLVEATREEPLAGRVPGQRAVEGRGGVSGAVGTRYGYRTGHKEGGEMIGRREKEQRKGMKEGSLLGGRKMTLGCRRALKPQ